MSTAPPRSSDSCACGSSSPATAPRTTTSLDLARSASAPPSRSAPSSATWPGPTPAPVDRYVYGSAEVVGLMCLRVFLAGDRAEDYDQLAPGAQRLGAAFQKLNFLRDLAEDHDTLGRCYFPGRDIDRFSDADRDR